MFNSVTLLSHTYNNSIPYLYGKIHDNSAFQGLLLQNSQSSDTFEKKNLSPIAKVGIALGGTVALAVVCDLVFAKGRHIKSIFKSAEKNIDDVRNTSNINHNVKPEPNSITTSQPKLEKKIYTEPRIYDEFITFDRAKDLPIYNSFDDALKDFQSNIAQANVDTPENVQELLKLLKQHNYGKDNSLISVATRTRDIDYNGKTIDILNNKVYNVGISDNPTLGCGQGQVDINMLGDYLIQNLSDGRKMVAISVPTGRFDSAGRRIRTKINILSKDHEFTPLQKDLIEIISCRKGRDIPRNAAADILSIGTVCRNGKEKHGGGFDINKDVFLASVDTAKRQLKPDEIDRDFINKALNLSPGDRLSLFHFGL